jgi:hypothetical protein
VDPEAVELTRAQLGNIPVPDQIGPLAQGGLFTDPATVRLIEETQLDGGGMFAEEREVHAGPIPR